MYTSHSDPQPGRTLVTHSPRPFQDLAMTANVTVIAQVLLAWRRRHPCEGRSRWVQEVRLSIPPPAQRRVLASSFHCCGTAWGLQQPPTSLMSPPPLTPTAVCPPRVLFIPIITEPSTSGLLPLVGFICYRKQCQLCSLH